MAGKQNQRKHRGPNGRQSYKVKKPAELLSFLLEVLSGKGRNSVKSILKRGQVQVNGKTETTHDFVLKPDQTVTILNKAEKEPDWQGLTLLHEDEDIIVVEKEAGLLSIASPKEKKLTAHRQLMDYVKSKNRCSRIFIVHRLDRDTSGVMLFAKNEGTKQKLQQSWREMVKERSYAALVEGEVKKPEGTISSYLKESSTLKMYSSPHPGSGRYAVTHYEKIQANQNFSLLKVRLETGRKNQIRVHMQDIGHPITGDKKYGAQGKEAGRLGLHAAVLAFYHPATGKLLRFETKVPPVFLKLSR